MRIIAIIKRICQQMIRDKRTLMLLLVAPLLVLSLMYYLFNTESTNPRLGTVDISDGLIQLLEKADLETVRYDQVSDETIREDKLDGILWIDDHKLTLTLENSDPTVANALRLKITQILTLNPALQSVLSSTAAKPPVIETTYVYGNADTNFFDVLSPVLIGFYVFFFVFLISGIGLLKERTTGTLDRLVSTPVQRWEIVVGYLIGYGIFAVLQTVITVLYAINVLGMVLVGSIWVVLLTSILSALVALSLGTLLSAFAASEFQMMQFIPIVIIPQVFFVGFIPLENLPGWLQLIGKIMPISYVAKAMKGVMYKGYDLWEILPELLILLAYAIVFILLNILALKKYRKL